MRAPLHDPQLGLHSLYVLGVSRFGFADGFGFTSRRTPVSDVEFGIEVRSFGIRSRARVRIGEGSGFRSMTRFLFLGVP